MHRPSRFAVLVFLLLTLGTAGAHGDAAPGKPVALVNWIEGEATVRATAESPPEPLALFRFLAPGAVLETSPGATVTVVFFDGQRESIVGPARIVVRPTTLYAESGHLRHLTPVPAIVDLAPLLSDGARRRRMPATRIRGGNNAITGLQPRDGAPVRRGAVTLSFDVDPEVKVYQVVLRKEGGPILFRWDLLVPPVRVPLRLLRPGILYQWSVEPKVPPDPDRRGEAMFITLDSKEERAFKTLESAARRSGEPDLAQLLLEIDRSLGRAEPVP